jgi:ATP-grasp domain
MRIRTFTVHGLQSRPAHHNMARASLGRWPCHGPDRAQRCRIRPSPGLWAWGVRLSRSPRASSCWQPGGVASERERRANSANSAEAAVEIAEELGFPVVLKVDSPDILHKTEAGVVRLNLGDMAEARTAYAEILASAEAYASQARITGVSVVSKSSLASIATRDWAWCCCSVVAA